MFLKSTAVIFICSIFATESAFVDNLPKCALADNECMRNLYEYMVRDIGETGISELGIPPVNSIDLKNVTVIVMDLLSLTIVEGVATGIKDCVFDKFSINIKEERGLQENTCNVTVKGHYIVSASNPVIKNFFGGNNIHGDGNGEVNIEKLHLKFDFPFFAQIRDDGEIYIKCIYDKIKYDYEVLGKTTFYADNIYLGDQEIKKLHLKFDFPFFAQLADDGEIYMKCIYDKIKYDYDILGTTTFYIDNIYMGDQKISNVVTTFLSENWGLIINTFGKVFIDKAIEFYFKFSGNFLDAVPAKYNISDDLTPDARKQS